MGRELRFNRHRQTQTLRVSKTLRVLLLQPFGRKRSDAQDRLAEVVLCLRKRLLSPPFSAQAGCFVPFRNPCGETLTSDKADQAHLEVGGSGGVISAHSAPTNTFRIPHSHTQSRVSI